MGANPTGSNNKPRATLIFGTKEELELYKRLVHDIGNLRKMNAAELVMALLEEEYKTVTAKQSATAPQRYARSTSGGVCNRSRRARRTRASTGSSREASRRRCWNVARPRSRQRCATRAIVR